MANLYLNEQKAFEEPSYIEPSYIRQDFSLFNLFSSDIPGYVEGIKFLSKNTPAWHEHMKIRKEELKGSLVGPNAEERAKEIIARESEQDVVYAFTDFEAMNFMFKHLIADPSQNTVCYVSVLDRQIDVLVYYLMGDYPAKQYFDLSKKAKVHGHFYYDGSLQDALVEFAEQGFTFNRCRWLLGKEPPVTGEKIKESGIIVTAEGISLDDIFRRKN